MCNYYSCSPQISVEHEWTVSSLKSIILVNMFGFFLMVSCYLFFLQYQTIGRQQSTMFLACDVLACSVLSHVCTFQSDSSLQS